mmetsp:Transcript_2887/g.7411  ORF Transcript_2887/g.7411 Transcript_2887/m.7411 type:complete len:387 (-) Transcript_2887:289-1449(-)
MLVVSSAAAASTSASAFACISFHSSCVLAIRIETASCAASSFTLSLNSATARNAAEAELGATFSDATSSSTSSFSSSSSSSYPRTLAASVIAEDTTGIASFSAEDASAGVFKSRAIACASESALSIATKFSSSACSFFSCSCASFVRFIMTLRKSFRSFTDSLSASNTCARNASLSSSSALTEVRSALRSMESSSFARSCAVSIVLRSCCLLSFSSTMLCSRACLRERSCAICKSALASFISLWSARYSLEGEEEISCLSSSSSRASLAGVVGNDDDDNDDAKSPLFVDEGGIAVVVVVVVAMDLLSSSSSSDSSFSILLASVLRTKRPEECPIASLCSFCICLNRSRNARTRIDLGADVFVVVVSIPSSSSVVVISSCSSILQEG